jgi:hypothetical protein
MQHSFPKQAFLDDLLARNAANLALVQTTFAPLDRDTRSTQPERGEWSVDQCIQHLVLAGKLQLAQLEPLLARDAGVNSAETFARSWLARRHIWRRQFDPRTKTKTMGKVTPSDHFYPDVYLHFAAQKERVAALLQRASQNNLQKSCWYLRMAPINVGDYLELLVRHDELHIDQAQRALAAYRQFAAT